MLLIDSLLFYIFQEDLEIEEILLLHVKRYRQVRDQNHIKDRILLSCKIFLIHREARQVMFF